MKTQIISFLLLLSMATSYSQNVEKTMIRLPDTGQNQSYTNTFGEDNDFNIYMPYFTINGNGTVTDTITGLMWQQGDGGEMTIENAHTYCANLSLGGYTDWRLPNAHESFSILNHQNANPAMNTTVFPATQAEYWWTSDRQFNDSSKVWVTNAGGGIGNHPKAETISAGGTKKFHARAVRDITAPVMVPNHYTDNGNGSITDNLTQLVWQKVPFADSLSWEQALSYADTLTLAASSDWRLPNIKELQSINDERRINPSLNNTFFSVSAPGKYWSSTTLPNQTTKAWYLNTQFGITTYDQKTVKHYILCVRGNQVPTGKDEKYVKTLAIYPNPFSSSIYVKNRHENDHMELLNANGQLLYSGVDIEKENLSYLPAGLYILKITGKSNISFKLLKEE